MSADTVPVETVNKAIDGDLDSLIVAVRALEIPLKHELALKYLTELRDARLEAHELSSEIVRQMREIAALRAERVNTDPLDETDHRPRHTKAGQMLYRHGLGHWHSFTNAKPCMADCPNSIALWARTFGPLTICTCPEADHV